MVQIIPNWSKIVNINLKELKIIKNYLKKIQNSLNGQKLSKFDKIVQIGLKWSNMVIFGPI